MEDELVVAEYGSGIGDDAADDCTSHCMLGVLVTIRVVMRSRWERD